MQIVSLGDSLHEISNLFFYGKNKKKVNLSLADLAQRMVS